MKAPALRIRRWRSELLVPHDSPAPARLRADLDAIADGLPDQLASGLARWCSTTADEVVLVKSLAFDCELDLGRKPEFLVARWAYQFGKALINAVESGGDGVLRFSSSAAYGAQFIADLASGLGAAAWYYRPYAGLAALPPAAAIRTVLLEDLELGRQILLALSPETWDRLGAVLTRREALRILEELSASGTSEDTEPASLAALYREHASRLPAPWFVTALYLFSVGMRAGFGPTPDVARWVVLAAKLTTLAARANVATLADALQQGNIGALVAVDTEGDAESWAALSVRPRWRSTLAEILRAGAAQPSDTMVTARGEGVRTGFGGLVLLLPELDGLLDEALTGALPRAARASARDLAAWLVLAQCAGRARATQFVGESFWRDVFGVPPGIDRARLTPWLADADSAPAETWLAERAVVFARGTCLPTPLKAGRHRWLLPVDQSSGTWCGPCSDLGSPRPKPTQERGADSPWRSRLATARRARDDWRYLAMDWGLPEAWQRLFTQLAQIVLRRFAYRIPGFAGASLPHVHANFLAGRGTFDPESGRLQLDRPPLHVLLNVTGIGRGTVRWSGPPERVFQLDYAP